MKIEINKDTTYTEVKKIAEYVAAKTNNYELIRLINEDNELLNSFWEESISTILDLFKSFIATRDTTVNFIVTLQDNDCTNTQVQASMVDTLKIYLSNFIVAKWLAVVSLKEAEAYVNTAKMQMQTIKRMLYHREPPKRK